MTTYEGTLEMPRIPVQPFVIQPTPSRLPSCDSGQARPRGPPRRRKIRMCRTSTHADHFTFALLRARLSFTHLSRSAAGVLAHHLHLAGALEDLADLPRLDA